MRKIIKKKIVKKQKQGEATHELIDGEVQKVDLVERPATGDIWLAVRSKDAAQQILKQGEWAMRTAMAAEDVSRTHEVSEADDQPLTVALDETGTETEPPESVPEITPLASVPSGDFTSLTREDVRDVINSVVPGIVAETMRALGVGQVAQTPEKQDADLAPAEAPAQPADAPVARAGAKMSGKRLKRFSGALASIQQGLGALGDIHRELAGGDGKGDVKRDVDLTEQIIAQVSGLLSQHSATMLADVKREVGDITKRVDKIQAASVKPSAVPVDKTEEVQRAQKTGDMWTSVVRGNDTQF